ncbi:hypothetical protein DFS34DRAFT_277599 [Phlyctochytrium arcticum]|nr:hypothetical protein DFS34DRAFT_277599 [Phlyctochytrium arcticum]
MASQMASVLTRLDGSGRPTRFSQGPVGGYATNPLANWHTVLRFGPCNSVFHKIIDHTSSTRIMVNICMVPDFLEAHLYHLSERLILRGHRVCRCRCKDFTSGVRIYHLPHRLVLDQVSLPIIHRYILIRECIDVIHGNGV